MLTKPEKKQDCSLKKRIAGILAILTTIAISVDTLAQNVSYLDLKLKPTTEQKAEIIRKPNATGDRIIEIQRDKTGDTLQVITLKLLNPYTEDGTAIYYDKNHNEITRGYFSDGYMDGKWYFKSENGNRYDSVDYTGVREYFLKKDKGNSENEALLIVDEMPVFIYDTTMNSRRKDLDDQALRLMELKNKYKNDPSIRQINTNYDNICLEKRSIEYSSFNTYLDKNVYYPPRSRFMEKQGVVIVRAVVDQEGNVVKPSILRSSKDRDLDFEALRLVMNSPKWKPGKQNGHPVSVSVFGSISFKK